MCAAIYLHSPIRLQDAVLNRAQGKLYLYFLEVRAEAGPCHTPAVRPRWPGFEPRSDNVGFVVNKMALRQVSSMHFGFPCQFSFHRLLHTHHLSSGAGTIGQLVADVPSGLSLTPPRYEN
jgi:hypothetical protein